MGFKENKDEQFAFDRAIGADALEPGQKPGFEETFKAAFRQENTFGSLIVQQPDLPDSVIDNENFDLWGSLTEEERLDEQFLSNVSNADNIIEVDAVRKQRAREQRDREIISEGSFLPTLMATAFDPINLIPVGGTAYRTYKTGSSILKAGLATGSVAAGSTAAIEASLHQTQLTRTFGESATNITAAGFLGMVLGSTPKVVQGLINKSEVDGVKLNSDIDRVMDPEGAIANGKMSTLESITSLDEVKIDLLQEARMELTPIAGNKLSRGDRESLIGELSSTKYTLSNIKEVTAADVAEKLDEVPQNVPARKRKAQAVKIAEEERQSFIDKLNDTINVINSKLEKDKIASDAFSDLSRVEQGILPNKYQDIFDQVSAESKNELKIKVGDEEILIPDIDPVLNKSVGAAQVLDDAGVRGKVAKAVTKAIGIDPLSRTITSDASSTRRAVNRLAENPLDMDQPLRTSVESKIKIHDGKLFEGFEANQKAFIEYQKAGGNLKRRAFNEAVGKAVRNGSDDVHIQRAADDIDAKVYEPLKNSAIEAKLLPDDVEVTTAKRYLNRLWKKEKLSSNLENFVGVTSRWMAERQPDIDIDEARSIAREIAGRIMSTPDGRLPYDYKIAENSSKGGKPTSLKGQFKSRSFDIPDELVEDFLENDIELLMGRYVKSVAPDIELVKEFGDVNLTNEIKDIEQEWISRIEKASKAGNEKEARKLAKQKDADIRDISAMRDRLRGVYGQTNWDNPWVRAGRVARDLNYMRLLGGVVASSLPDVARVFAAEGIVRTFSDGLVPMIKNIKGFKASAREAKLYGVGADALMGGRSEIIADVADFAQGGTAFERGVRAAATKFSSVNLMNQWTGGIKQLHAVVQQSRLIGELKAGKVDPRLEQLGISKADALNIAGEMKKYSKKVDGVWIANSKEWENQELAMMWGAALRKESDRVIIVPGQERPLFMSSELGKTIFQFKTFMFSATQRVLISNLQQQDKHYMQGLLGMVGIGMLSYALKNWDAGRDVSDDPAVWVTEGIDRSGMLGMLMEANNTIEKITTNHYGLRPLLGINAPAARYASRSALDSALGPTFGLAGEVVRVAGAATGERDWSDSDTRALRRLLPGQNISILRQGLDQIEKGL